MDKLLSGQDAEMLAVIRTHANVAAGKTVSEHCAHLLPDLGLLQDYMASLQRAGAPEKARMALLTCMHASNPRRLCIWLLGVHKILKTYYCLRVGIAWLLTARYPSLLAADGSRNHAAADQFFAT